MGDRWIMWYKSHFEAFELGAVSTSVLRRQVLVEASDLNAVQFCRKELKNQEVQDDEMQVRKRWQFVFGKDWDVYLMLVQPVVLSVDMGRLAGAFFFLLLQAALTKVGFPQAMQSKSVRQPSDTQNSCFGLLFLVLTFLHFLWLTFLLLILWWIVCLGLVRHSEDSNRAKHPKHPTRAQIPWPHSAELGAFALAFCRWMNLAVVGAWNCCWLLLLGIFNEGEVEDGFQLPFGAPRQWCEIATFCCWMSLPTTWTAGWDGSWWWFFFDFGDGSWWRVQVSQEPLVFFVVFFWLQRKKKLAFLVICVVVFEDCDDL